MTAPPSAEPVRGGLEPRPRGLDNDGLLLRNYWYALLRHRRPLALTVVLIMGASVLATYFQPSLYRATALIQIDQGNVSIASDSARAEGGLTYEEFFTTQQGILASRTLSRRVIERLGIDRHAVFDEVSVSTENDPERLLMAKADALLEMLRIAPRRNTQLLELSYITPAPSLSADLANALAFEYIAYTAESEAGFARSTSAFIRGQIDKLQSEIAEKEKTLQEHSEREDVLLTDERDTMIVQQYETLQRELIAAQADRVDAEADYRSLSKADHGSIPEVSSTATVQDLHAQAAELRQELAMLTSKFKDGYPEVERVRDAIIDVEARLSREIEVVAEAAVADARLSFERARSRELLLEKALEEQRQRTVAMNEATTESRRAQMELDNQRQMLEQLLRQQSATGLSADIGESESLTTVRLVDEAVAPSERYSPRLALNVGIGFSLAILTAIAVVFVLQHTKSAIQDADEVRLYTSMNVLGIIPRTDQHAALSGLKLSGSKKKRRKRASAARRAYSALLGERFKFVRSSLLASNGDDRSKIILVTSSNRDEGKTFVSCGLAHSFAELGMKVLLVDADLRRPSLHSVLETENKVGVTNLVNNGGDIRTVARTTTVPNLSVLLAGPPNAAPAELLGSKGTERVLRQAGEAFDVVVVDTSPLLPVVDTLSLLDHSDAVIVVIRCGETTQQAAVMSRELIEQSDGTVTGAILNDVDLADAAYRYYYGPLDYGYGENQE